jgi:hypothetical protein
MKGALAEAAAGRAVGITKAAMSLAASVQMTKRTKLLR